MNIPEIPEPPVTVPFSMEDVVGLLGLADALEQSGVEGEVPVKLRDLAARLSVLCKGPQIYRSE